MGVDDAVMVATPAEFLVGDVVDNRIHRVSNYHGSACDEMDTEIDVTMHLAKRRQFDESSFFIWFTHVVFVVILALDIFLGVCSEHILTPIVPIPADVIHNLLTNHLIVFWGVVDVFGNAHEEATTTAVGGPKVESNPEKVSMPDH